MFDFAWTEIALIGAVAMVAIGPKDMPRAIRTVAEMVKKARRMAGEFQTHVDEMVREANLEEVRTSFNQIRNFDIKGAIEKHVDADGSLQSSLSSTMTPGWTPPAVVTSETIEPLTGGAFPAESLIAETGAQAPAFIPPEIANRPEPPAFIPPEDVRW